MSKVAVAAPFPDDEGDGELPLVNRQSGSDSGSDMPPELMDSEQFLLSFPELKPPKFINEVAKKAEKERYTGERLKKDHPEVYKWLCLALADPRMSYRRITEISGVKHYILKAIEWQEGLAIAANKKVLANKWGCVSDLVTDKLIELVPEATKIGELSVLGGIATDKRMQLLGDATQKIDITFNQGPTLAEQMREMLAQAEAKFREMKQAQVVEVVTERLGEGAA